MYTISSVIVNCPAFKHRIDIKMFMRGGVPVVRTTMDGISQLYRVSVTPDFEAFYLKHAKVTGKVPHWSSRLVRFKRFISTKKIVVDFKWPGEKEFCCEVTAIVELI